MYTDFALIVRPILPKMLIDKFTTYAASNCHIAARYATRATLRSDCLEQIHFAIMPQVILQFADMRTLSTRLRQHLWIARGRDDLLHGDSYPSAANIKRPDN